MAQIPYPNNYDDNFMNIFKRIIDELNAKGYTYDQAIRYAEEILDEAKQTNDMNKEVDKRLDNIIADSGTSSTEVVDARGEYDILRNRLDGERKEVDASIMNVNSKISLKFGNLDENAIWSWWVHPLSLYTNGITFTSFTDNNGWTWVSKYTHATGHYEKTNISQNEVDDHNAPNIIKLDNGKMATFYSRHNLDNFLRYRISNTVEGIDFGEEQTITMPSIVTYAQATVDLAGNLHVFTRVGTTSWYYLRSTDNGSTWDINRKLVEFGTGNQGYLKIKHKKSSNVIRIAFVGHPTNGNVHSIYYGYIRDYSGEFIVDSVTVANLYDGTNMPLALSDLHTVYDADATGKKARLFDIGEELEIVFVEFTDNNDGVYKYARWNGSGFDIRDIVPSGVPIGGGSYRYYFGGMIFPNASLGVVYLAREENGEWFIERATTKNDGVTWDFELINHNTNDKSFRPYVPIGASSKIPVIWAEGTYAQNNYTEFSTSLQFPGELQQATAEVFNLKAELSSKDVIERSNGVIYMPIDGRDKLISFSEAFDDMPDVFVTSHKGEYITSVNNVSSASFVIRISSRDGQPVTEEVPVRWMAVGKR